MSPGRRISATPEGARSVSGAGGNGPAVPATTGRPLQAPSVKKSPTGATDGDSVPAGLWGSRTMRLGRLL